MMGQPQGYGQQRGLNQQQGYGQQQVYQEPGQYPMRNQGGSHHGSHRSFRQGSQHQHRHHNRRPQQYHEDPESEAGLKEGMWKHTLFGCFDDISSCVMSCCCQCIQYGQNQETFSSTGCFGNCCVYAILMCCGVQWCLHCSFRGQIRAKWNLPGSDIEDCATVFCCECCALSQEARELRERIEGGL